MSDLEWKLYCCLKLLKEYSDNDNIYDPIGNSIGNILEEIKKLESK